MPSQQNISIILSELGRGSEYLSRNFTKVIESPTSARKTIFSREGPSLTGIYFLSLMAQFIYHSNLKDPISDQKHSGLAPNVL